MNAFFALLVCALVGCGHAEKADFVHAAPKMSLVGTAQSQCAKPGVAALTIDDHIEEAALVILEEKKTRAAFFPIGKSVDEAMVARALALGHTVGNHSYSHANLALLNSAEINTELDAADKALGFEAVYMRPPFGEYNVNVLNSTSKIVIIWAGMADPESYKATQGIVLLHDVSRIKSVIEQHEKAGIKLVSLAECLGS